MRSGWVVGFGTGKVRGNFDVKVSKAGMMSNFGFPFRKLRELGRRQGKDPWRSATDSEFERL